MRVLLVATNRERSPFPVAPIGALMVAAAARRAGHDVDMLDMTFATSPKRLLRAALKTNRYRAVGFSIRNLDNCLFARPINYYGEVNEMFREARRLTSVPLIVGGSGFSIAPHGWMTRLRADYGIVGEGEHTFVRLLERLETGQTDGDWEGILRPVDSSEGSPLQPTSTRPKFLHPPAHELCAYSRHIGRGGFVGVQSKRGCPYSCIYCTYPLLEGTMYRVREPKLVVEEIESVSNGDGISSLFFTDSVFNTPRDHALALCEELARCKTPPAWMACCNPVGFDGGLARAMARAGCVGIEFSLDAATEAMLDRLGKPFSQSDIRRSLEAAKAADLPVAIHLLFGGPEEKPSDISETQDFLDSCPTPSAVFASMGIRIYAGTPLEEIALDDGTLLAGTDLFFPVFYVSRELGDNPVGTLDEIARRRPEWSTPTDWSRWTLRLVQRIMNRKRTRPQWRDAINYGKYMRW